MSETTKALDIIDGTLRPRKRTPAERFGWHGVTRDVVCKGGAEPVGPAQSTAPYWHDWRERGTVPRCSTDVTTPYVRTICTTSERRVVCVRR